MFISPQLIKDDLDKVIIGQEDAKRVIATAVYIQKMKQYLYSRGLPFDGLPKNNVLLVGPTGCGKTELINTAAIGADLPTGTVDATNLNQGDAWYGDSICEWFKKQYWAADLARFAIVVIDEVDKLGGGSMTSTSGHLGIGIQNNLLTILEGRMVEIGGRMQVSTKDMLFVFCGAFENKEFIKNQKSIGFKGDVTATNETFTLKHEHFEDLGLINEFVGRINMCAQLKKLNVDDLKQLLLYSTTSPLHMYKSLFELGGVDISPLLGDGEIGEIAKVAHASKFGARYLKNLIHEKLAPHLFKLGTNIDYNFYEPIETEVEAFDGVEVGTTDPQALYHFKYKV